MGTGRDSEVHKRALQLTHKKMSSTSSTDLTQERRRNTELAGQLRLGGAWKRVRKKHQAFFSEGKRIIHNFLLRDLDSTVMHIYRSIVTTTREH